MAVTGDNLGSIWVGALLTTYGEKYLRQLAQQNITVHMVSSRALMDIISNGEYALSPTITDAHVMDIKKKGASVDWVSLEPAVVTLGQLTLPKFSSHPYAALLYIDFELSQEAGKIYTSIGYDSPRKDIPGGKEYRKFYGAQSTKEVVLWKETFDRLFVKQ